MRRILAGIVLAFALLTGRANAQSSNTPIKFGVMTRYLLNDTQGLSGAALDTGWVSIRGCRATYVASKNSGTVSSPTMILQGMYNGIAFGDTGGYRAFGAVNASQGQITSLHDGVSAPFDAIRVQFTALANVTMRVLIWCLK